MKLSPRDCSVNDYIDYRNALIGRPKINTLMYFDIDTCTLLRKPERRTESRVSYRCLSICVNDGILNFSNFVCMQFFVDAIPLCLLLNKLHLFNLTQSPFILIPLDTSTCMLHVSVCTLAILRHVITKTIQRKAQYSYCWCVICTRIAKFQDEKRGLLLSKFCSKIFRDTWNI